MNKVLLRVSLAGACFVLIASCRHRGRDDDDDRPKDKAADAGPSAPDIVTLSDEAVTQAGIVISSAKSEPLLSATDLPAEIEADPSRLAEVSSLSAARIESVLVHQGDHVEKNATLAVLLSTDSGDARAGLEKAHAELDVANAAAKRQRDLTAAGIGAQKDLLEAEGAAKRAQADVVSAEQRASLLGSANGETRLKSPLAGEVLEQHAVVGATASAAESLFKVGDLKRVFATGHLSADDSAQIEKGSPATLLLAAYPGESFGGAVDYVSPVLDEKTRTLTVRMTLDNKDGRLRPGLFGTLAVSPKAGAVGVTVVPETSVQRTPAGDVVFVPGAKEGSFRAVPVAVGQRRHGLVEIKNGVTPADKVVVAGAFVLKSVLLRGLIADED